MAALDRGPHPVGVRTATLEDDLRPLAVELWYPAMAALQGRDETPLHQDLFEVLPGMRGSRQAALRDAAPSRGPWPLVVFSHGFGGHRRQSSFLCTHLASHGFAVVGVDHAGNTLADLARPMMRAMRGQPVDLFVDLETIIEERPRDLLRAVDHAVALFDLPVDTSRYAVVGHSFGGWTALQLAGLDERVAAVTGLAPVGGPHPRGDGFERALNLDWPRPVPTVLVVAGQDSMVPLEGTRELFTRVHEPKRWLGLDDADHLHFCDRPRELHEMYRTMPMAARAMGATRALPPFADLCSAEHGFATARGVALAMTNVLTGEDVWPALDEIVSALRMRGVSLSAEER